MAEPKKPVDRALDVLVYAPIGFALEARGLMPKLIERGRQQMTTQVTTAKMMGQFAVQQGQVEATKAMNKAQASATSALEDLGLGGAPSPAEAPPTPRSAVDPHVARAGAPSPPPAPGPERMPPTPPVPGPGPAPGVAAEDVATLAVPDYASLAASQVVPRLAGLSGEELEAVRAYEAAKRGRKTILNRIAQLQSDQPS